MPNTLTYRDGFRGQSPELRDDVKRLQQALKKAGHAVDTDGLFGQSTADAVKAFQHEQGLEADGVVGSNTWQALEGMEEETRATGTSHDTFSHNGFRGNLAWIHAREGHAGKAYWPGGASGVTFDPGVDLGHAKPEMIEKAYKDLLTPEQLEAAKTVYGIKGDDADNALKINTVLQSIRINSAQAEKVFEQVVQPYWSAIVRRFPSLADSDTLPTVQTAMLSIAYNRGPGNRALDELEQPIANKDWSQIADIIGSMQQDHRLAGIRRRRKMEAELIRSELA